jgi:hypothetical protein
VLALVLPVLFAAWVEAERVLALVNGVPVLASDVDLAEAGSLVPRQPGETDDAYRRVTVEALIDLELRWQDLEAAALAPRIAIDLDAAWQKTVQRAGGEQELRARLKRVDLSEDALRELVRRAAVVEGYVASRFGPFTRPTAQEVERAWERELVPKLQAAGKPVPDLSQVRPEVEALLRERKLSAEVERWTADLAKHAEIIRYLPAPESPTPVPPTTPTPRPPTPGPP